MASEPNAHPAASILAEIAEEARRNPEFWREFEIEYSHLNGDFFWAIPATRLELLVAIGENCPVRRRPRTVEINGWQVPEPVRDPLQIGAEYWVVSLLTPGLTTKMFWTDDSFDNRFLSLGLIHLTPEAAEAHSRALASFTSREDEG